MQIVRPHIKDIAKDFWDKAGMNTYPCDILGAVSLILPIDIVSLSKLSLVTIQEWLNARNVYIDINVNNRELHGFILTNRGNGIMFINGTDHENERRFTIAHEVSHFLLDYKILRDIAIQKFGDDILPVIDGERPPSLEEEVKGIISSINIKPFTHLLEKDGDGSFNSIKAFKAENNADELAIELLSPYDNVVIDIRQKRGKLSFEEVKYRAYLILIYKYKLPESIAKLYAKKLGYKITGGPSILNKLGF